MRERRKRCRGRCAEWKRASDFYVQPGMRDGRAAKCKECTKQEARERRAVNVEEHRARDRARRPRSGKPRQYRVGVPRCSECVAAGKKKPGCYECHKVAMKDRYWVDPEASRTKERERSLDPARRAQLQASLRRQREADPEKFNRVSREWAARNPEKRAAYSMVANAIKRGDLVKGPCEGCGKPPSRRVHAHHADYSKPLEVRWLCTHCHGLEHRAENEANREGAA